MESLWTVNTSIKPRPPLKQSITTQAVVIGAGLAGILTAYLLQENNIEVVVLEANSIGSGQTAGTTGKITLQHNLIYTSLYKNKGIDYAKMYANAGQEAIRMYEEIIQEENIDCDYEKMHSYLYTNFQKEKLIEELKIYQKIGINGKLTTDTSLPFSVQAALKVPNQAQFQPLKFVEQLSDKLTVYEQTIAYSVEPGCVVTNHGLVKAQYIVFACHFPFENLPGYYFMKMHQERSYLMALVDKTPLNGMYLGIDEGGFTFRRYDNFILMGGEGHRTGFETEKDHFYKLRSAALDWFPNSYEAYAWSAQDCVSVDYVPYIGRYSSDWEDVYVITGFKKWGMSTSMTAAKLIVDKILGKGSLYENLFYPKRFIGMRNMSRLVKHGTISAKNLIKQKVSKPKKTLEDLKPGQGGIINYKGNKLGAYKEPGGKTFLVTTKCPHLGCQLSWNEQDHTWDCPCHGSRFHYDGSLIDNPSLGGIQYEKDEALL